MAKEYSLDLYQNAIDSLNEGMSFYTESLSDASKYKFCIIIISNFMELMLKHMVEKQNPLLMFEKPYEKNIKRTINYKQSIQILVNLDICVKKELTNDINTLYEIRNNIIHYKFEYNTTVIRSIIIKVIDGLRKLYNTVTKKDFICDVSEHTRNVFKKIEDDYSIELHLAQGEAEEEAIDEGLEIIDCGYCCESKTAVERTGNEIYCHYCKETDFFEECSRCTEKFKISEMEYFGINDYGYKLYFCESCCDYAFGDD